MLEVEVSRFGGDGGDGSTLAEVEGCGDGVLGGGGATFGGDGGLAAVLGGDGGLAAALGGDGGFASGGDGACTGGVLGVTSIVGACGALGLTGGGGGGMAPSEGLISGATGLATAIASTGLVSVSSGLSAAGPPEGDGGPDGFLLITLGGESPGTRFAFKGLGSGCGEVVPSPGGLTVGGTGLATLEVGTGDGHLGGVLAGTGEAAVEGPGMGDGAVEVAGLGDTGLLRASAADSNAPTAIPGTPASPGGFQGDLGGEVVPSGSVSPTSVDMSLINSRSV